MSSDGNDAIPPDTKDWTWVLDRPCPDCGYDATEMNPEEIGGLIRSVLPLWESVLDSSHVTQRPDPHVWSPLEYCAHIRDVYRVMAGRVDLMVREDDPEFPDWDQDATAVERDYAHENPAHLASELAEATEQIAARFDAVSGDAWQRAGRRSDGSRFTIGTLGLYLVHEVVHHLWDNRSALDS